MMVNDIFSNTDIILQYQHINIRLKLTHSNSVYASLQNFSLMPVTRYIYSFPMRYQHVYSYLSHFYHISISFNKCGFYCRSLKFKVTVGNKQKKKK